MDAVSITAILPAYDRVEQTLTTIARLTACQPPPAEILVHLDNGADFPLPAHVRVLRSPTNLGPGGGRNLLIKAARCEWVASFDDDSFPVEEDFFAKAMKAIGDYPQAAVIACPIIHRNVPSLEDCRPKLRRTATFVGCGCIYQRSAFLETEGYVPLPVAYGMEEIDLALQLHAAGRLMVEVPQLEVFHDTDLSHHDSPRITAGSIKNQALLTWVRYPLASFPYGFLQWLNKAKDNLLRRRFRGAIKGMLETPGYLWRHRKLRQPVAPGALRSFRALVHDSEGTLASPAAIPLPACAE